MKTRTTDLCHKRRLRGVWWGPQSELLGNPNPGHLLRKRAQRSLMSASRYGTCHRHGAVLGPRPPGSSGPLPFVATRQSRRALSLRGTAVTTVGDLHLFCLSFCPQGAQLLFSPILQSILKLRKELQLGQVRTCPCAPRAVRDIPGGPARSVTDVTRHRESPSVMGSESPTVPGVRSPGRESAHAQRALTAPCSPCGVHSGSAP